MLEACLDADGGSGALDGLLARTVDLVSTARLPRFGPLQEGYYGHWKLATSFASSLCGGAFGQGKRNE